MAELPTRDCICAQCGAEFKTKSKTAKYCPACKHERDLAYSRAAMARKRAKTGSGSKAEEQAKRSNLASYVVKSFICADCGKPTTGRTTAVCCPAYAHMRWSERSKAIAKRRREEGDNYVLRPPYKDYICATCGIAGKGYANTKFCPECSKERRREKQRVYVRNGQKKEAGSKEANKE